MKFYAYPEGNEPIISNVKTQDDQVPLVIKMFELGVNEQGLNTFKELSEFPFDVETMVDVYNGKRQYPEGILGPRDVAYIRTSGRNNDPNDVLLLVKSKFDVPADLVDGIEIALHSQNYVDNLTPKGTKIYMEQGLDDTLSFSDIYLRTEKQEGDIEVRFKVTDTLLEVTGTTEDFIIKSIVGGVYQSCSVGTERSIGLLIHGTCYSLCEYRHGSVNIGDVKITSDEEDDVLYITIDYEFEEGDYRAENYECGSDRRDLTFVTKEEFAKLKADELPIGKFNVIAKSEIKDDIRNYVPIYISALREVAGVNTLTSVNGAPEGGCTLDELVAEVSGGGSDPIAKLLKAMSSDDTNKDSVTLIAVAGEDACVAIVSDDNGLDLEEKPRLITGLLNMSVGGRHNRASVLQHIHQMDDRRYLIPKGILETLEEGDKYEGELLRIFRAPSEIILEMYDEVIVNNCFYPDGKTGSAYGYDLAGIEFKLQIPILSEDISIDTLKSHCGDRVRRMDYFFTKEGSGPKLELIYDLAV